MATIGRRIHFEAAGHFALRQDDLGRRRQSRGQNRGQKRDCNKPSYHEAQCILSAAAPQYRDESNKEASVRLGHDHRRADGSASDINNVSARATVGLTKARVECINCGRIFKQILVATPSLLTVAGVCLGCRGLGGPRLFTPRGGPGHGLRLFGRQTNGLDSDPDSPSTAWVQSSAASFTV